MAKVFLKSTDTRHTAANSDTTVFGSYGNQSVVISASAKRVFVDANVERVQFASAISSYKFKQVGNRLDVYDSSGTLVSKIGVQNDTDGTQLAFVNGTVNTFDAKFVAPGTISTEIISVETGLPETKTTTTSLGITVGGITVSSSSPTAITAVDTMVPSVPPILDPAVDSTAPTYQSATVSDDGKTIALTFDEVLSSASATANMFDIFFDDAKTTPSAAAIVDDSSIVLTLAKTAAVNQNIKVVYNSPITLSSANTNAAIQDLAGNDTETFSVVPTNASTIDLQGPKLLTAEVSPDGMNLYLIYDETLGAVTPPLSAYSVKFGMAAADTTAPISAIDVTNTIVTLTLNKPITSDQKLVNVSYNAGSDGLQDLVGNLSTTVTGKSVTNNSTSAPDLTAPALINSEVSEDGKSIVLTFDEALGAKSAAASTFGVFVDGVKMIPTAAKVVDSTLVLSLTKTIAAKEDVSVSYTAPIASPLKTNAAIQDLVGNDAAKFEPTVVVNKSAVSPFTFVPDSFNVTEGNSLTFTVTKRTTVPTDTMLYWGKSNVMDVNPANNDDIDPKYGSVTIPANKSTTTFKVAFLNDGITENAETISMALLNSNIEQIAVTGIITISDAVTHP